VTDLIKISLTCNCCSNLLYYSVVSKYIGFYYLRVIQFSVLLGCATLFLTLTLFLFQINVRFTGEVVNLDSVVDLDCKVGGGQIGTRCRESRQTLQYGNQGSWQLGDMRGPLNPPVLVSPWFSPSTCSRSLDKQHR